MAEITFPIRVLAESGIRALLLTNSAGGINPRFQPGDFMCVTDHINFMGANPLREPPSSTSSCFLDLSEVYDPVLNRCLKAAGKQAKARVHSGVYIAVSGPSYETPAEIRAFARLGADAVGMSTVPEAIVARQLGIRVAALSCITNRASGRDHRPLSHTEVLAVGNGSQTKMSSILTRFVDSWRASPKPSLVL
jgi:purine-nucleoside phosphorylase